MSTLPTSLDRYRLVGRSGLRLSPLTLGTMTFGTESGWGADKKESRRILDMYLDGGGNSVDTANIYTGGASERYLGEFLEGRRDGVVLQTKFTMNAVPGDPNAGGNHRKSIVRSLEDSLQRLKTDYIDLLWVHAWEFRTPVEETMRALDDVVRAGKVLYVGISNTPAWKVAQANAVAGLRGWTPFVAVQLHYNLIERSIERDLLPMARECGLSVMPWSPLAAGILTGKYAPGVDDTNGLNASLRRKFQQKSVNERKLEIAAVVGDVARETERSSAQVALNWLLGRDGVTSPVIGARTVEQLEDNLASVQFSLTAEQRDRLDRVSRIDLGYPHSMLLGKHVRAHIAGGTHIEG